MRLLNTSTLELREFIGNATPKYAILSHTWGDKEATFQDAADFPRLRGLRGQSQPPASLDDDDNLLTPGTRKILDFCDLAQSDGHEWAWVDTCCIDKSSSAELSEAINSMYRWYAESDSCYVYLSDVQTSSMQPGFLSHEKLEQSRWFTRGWTLQEMIAPRLLEFYDVDWMTLGTKLHLCSRIVARTSISESALLEPWGMGYQEFPAGRRFSWAWDRTTTRDEDLAYSLMGLLGVNMPLLYGEGGDKAFYRLQQEYLVQREDLSILLWSWGLDCGSGAVLARRPAAFRPDPARYLHRDPETGHVTGYNFAWANVFSVPNGSAPLAITNRGFRVKLQAMRDHSSHWPVWIAYTSCVVMSANRQQHHYACISLKSRYESSAADTTPTVTRENDNVVWCVPSLWRFAWTEFYLDYRGKEKGPLAWPPEEHTLVLDHFASLELRLHVPESAQIGVSVSPPELALVDGSGRYTLTPERLSFPPTDGSLLSLQFGALVLDIPVPAPEDCTPSFETVAVTFGLTGAGSRAENLGGVPSLHGWLVWCDMVKIPTESRAGEAMEQFIRDLGDRARSAVLSHPKDKCLYSLGCGKVLWAFVKRGNSAHRTYGGIFHFPSTIHIVLQDEANPESRPRWLSSQMNASLFPEAPRDWR